MISSTSVPVGGDKTVVDTVIPYPLTGNGTSTMSNHIFNLVKSIVGAGVLSLPAGIASFGNAPSAVIPATVLITIIGVLSGYSFSLIGRVCAYTGGKTYRDAWERSVGKSTGIVPAASCTFKTVCATLAYSMILADTFGSLCASVGLTLTRSQTLLSVTSLFLLPLCLKKDLSSLAPFSLLGILGMAYTAAAMGVRFFQGAYEVGGKFAEDVSISFRPNFGTVGATGVFQPSTFILVCTLSTAYVAHFNAPKFYSELKNNTLRRFNTVVGTSFALSITLFSLIAGLGFATFGAASSGMILNNYSNRDVFMCISRIAVAISLVFSYPLAFAGCRDGVLDLANISVEKRTNRFLNKVSILILSVITVLALYIRDLSFVLSFGGATLGNALIYVYPALMFRAAVKKMGDKAGAGLKKEVNFALANALLGVSMGVVGVRMALKPYFGV